MPKRTDIKRILVIGSGPIVIGQACEFDYSGAQACKVLKEDGFEVILVNSNPATIMTDPGLADRTYVEPITAEFIERVIKKERPDALLPTLGGQTGLNAAVELAKDGTLDKYGVEMIGCDLAAIERGEDRKLFNEAMAEIGLEVARSGYAYSVADAEAIAERCDAVSASCHLSPRDDEICRLIASGKTNQQIERELFIASGTLKAHIQHIYVKCDVHSRKELIALCGGE